MGINMIFKKEQLKHRRIRTDTIQNIPDTAVPASPGSMPQIRPFTKGGREGIQSQIGLGYTNEVKQVSLLQYFSEPLICLRLV